MAVGIAAGTRSPQTNAMGGVNPLEMMRSMFELRNMQQQYSSNIEAGQILATAPDMDTAINTLRQSPNAAWQIPIINQLREGQLTQARVAHEQLNTDVDRAHAAIRLSTDPNSLVSSINEAKSRGNPGNAYLYDDIQKSLLGDLPSDPNAAVAAFKQRQAGLLIGSGLSNTEAYGALGAAPPTVTRIPGAMGGPETVGVVGGVGATPGATFGQQPATAPQLNQWGDLVKHQEELNDRVQGGASLVQGINEITKSLRNVDTGPLTPIRTAIAAVAKQLGADEPTMNVIRGGTDTAAAQESDKLFNQFALSRLGGGTLPGGRTLQQEYRDIVGSNPSLAMQKDAIQRILRMWQRSFVGDRMQQRFLSDYMTKNAHTPAAAAQWGPHWADIQQKKGLLGSDFLTADGKQGIPPGDVIELLGNPSARNVAEFDRLHGDGAASRYTDEDSP